VDDPWVRLRDFRHALARLGEVLASTRDRQVMVAALLETSTTYLGARCGVLYVTVAGSERLRPMETVGPPCALAEVPTGGGLAGTAAQSGSAVLWPGDGDAARPGPEEPDAGGAAVAIPLRSGGHPFGVLAYYGRAAPFDGEDVDSLAILVRQAETAIENSFLYEEAVRLSLTDGMTGLWNRDLRLESELSRAVRFAEPFGVVFVELDQMKAVNDSHGHQAGDTVLIELARRLTEAVREVDLVARWGGDEFTLLLPKTGLAGAGLLAEKIRTAVGTVPFRVDTGSLDLTISVGVAAYPDHGSSGKELVAAADAAMYRAKAGGRNRVEHAVAAGAPEGRQAGGTT